MTGEPRESAADARRRQIALRLVARLRHAKCARQIGETVPDSQPGQCHQNCARWAEAHPGDRVIRGWLDSSYQILPPTRQFSAHSVIETAGGDLLDVTLRSSEAQHHFLRHEGSPEEFDALTDPVGGLPWVRC